MRRAIVLQHVAFEGPARLAGLLNERGYSIDLRRLDLGEVVPERVAEGDLLVVMGGPMGVGDADRPEYPFLRDELQLLRRCVSERSPVLGICLGSQLLAHAAGAAVRTLRGPAGERSYEVGWGPIELQRIEAPDPLLDQLPAQMPVLHLHGDTWELPAGARLLASSARCRSQAFVLGSKLFGLQFHCEIDEAQVEALLRADAAFVTRANGPAGVEEIRRDTARWMTESWAFGQQLLRNILDAMTRPDPT